MRKLLALAALVALPALASGRWTIGGPDGGSVTRLVFDPADSSIVYAASTNGLFRSADGGRHWLAASALLGTRILDIAVAKSDSRTVFAATTYGLYKSTDRGASWRLVQSDSWFRVAVSAQNPDVVYSISFSGPVLSTDGGTTFGKAGSGLPAGGLPSALAVDPGNAAVLYASFPSSAGVYKSSDSGAHWAKASDGLTASPVFALAVDPTDGATLYACGSASAMFKSTNSAASWTRLETGTSGLACSALEVSPSAPSTVLTATSSATIISRDGGASWNAAAGVPDTGTSAVAFDPANAETFLAALAVHVRRTTDSGATSVVSDSGLTAFVTRAIAANPRDDAIVYAGGPGGFARSADHGRTWSLSTALQPTQIAVDANASTLYAIAGTVQRSVDGGVTWSPFGDGLPNAAPFFLTADRQLSGTLYAIVNGTVYKKVGDGAWVRRSDGLGDSMDFVTIDPHDSSTLYAGGPPGVFKSSNGASSWAPANNGLTGLNTVGLSVDPFDSRHLFAWSPTVIFESSDAAASWTRLTAGPRGTRDFDPSTRGVVYANAFDGVQRSSDGGTTWSLLAEGLPKSHSTLVVGAAGTPYLGDSSGGVFVYHFVHGRAAGR